MRVNKEIRAPQVRAIDGEGKQVGIIATQEAMKMAEQSGLDLVEVAPLGKPPVCRMMDFGKFRYEQTKSEREAKKKQSSGRGKEIKYRPTIDDHDYNTKLKRMLGFLSKGSKIKVTLAFRGREMAHKELGERLLDRIAKDVQGHGAVESRPRLLGRFYVMIIAPTRSH